MSSFSASKFFADKVQEYEFSSLEKRRIFDEEDGPVTSFEFTNFEDTSEKTFRAKENELNQERIRANEKQFKISPVVKEHRGLVRLEMEERERIIQTEVNRRVAELEALAVKTGYNEGVRRGREEVYAQTRMAVEEKLEVLGTMISEVLATQEELFLKQRTEIYQLINRLCKWIILRELKDDGTYVNRLLERLIVEMRTKKNLLIQVNKDHFKNMPEVLAIVQEKLGTMENVRVEVDYGINDVGLVVESENGIVNGTMEQQFKNLDKLFETVGLSEEQHE